MGMKKLARKRLFNVEKKGINIDSGVSEAMKKALIYATQHREGQKLVTDLLFDFGASAAGLKTKALAAADPIGPASGASFLCTIKNSIFGVVSTVETICLEAISDGTLTDYDLMFAGDGDLDGDVSSGNAGSLGTDAQNDTLLKADIGTLGQHELLVEGTDFTANQLSNKFLYLTSGDATDQKATATIDCSGADHTKMVNGVTTIRMLGSDASDTAVNFVANSGGNHDDAGADTQIKIGGMESAADLAQAISRGINANANFTTDDDSQAGSSTTITVTHAAVTATSNKSNFLVNDDPQSATGISVGAFTGGIDDGVAITSGKLLIRITGFVVPDDL